MHFEKGFIIPAKILNKQKFNNVFLRCLQSIRRIPCYAEIPIVVINDNSPFKFTRNDILINGQQDENLLIASNQWPGSGEIYPYIWNYQNQFFESFIMIHDSVIVKEPFQEEPFQEKLSGCFPLFSFDRFLICEEGSMLRFCAIINRLRKTQISWLNEYPLNRIDGEVNMEAILKKGTLGRMVWN